MPLNLTLTNEQKALVTAEPRTAGTSNNPDGSPAPIDGEVTFTVADETIATFERVDANSGYLVSVDGAEGATQVTVPTWAKAWFSSRIRSA